VVTPGQSIPADVKTSMDSLPEASSTIISPAHTTSDSKTEAKTVTSLTKSDGQEGADQQAGPSELSIAAVAGIVIGSLSILVLAAGLFW
jgi:hypothetical protein